MELYDKKFKLLKQNKAHILKSLVYFEDAEKDEMPAMIKIIDWKIIKEFFEKETLNLSKQLLQ